MNEAIEPTSVATQPLRESSAIPVDLQGIKLLCTRGILFSCFSVPCEDGNFAWTEKNQRASTEGARTSIVNRVMR
jgi:hypothetical protein